MPGYAISVSDNHSIASDYTISVTKTLRFLSTGTLGEPVWSGALSFLVPLNFEISKEDIQLTSENIDGEIELSVDSLPGNAVFTLRPLLGLTSFQANAQIIIRYVVPRVLDPLHEGSSIQFGFVPDFRCETYDISFQVDTPGRLPGRFIMRRQNQFGFDQLGPAIQPLGDDLERKLALPRPLESKKQVIIEYCHTKTYYEKLDTIEYILEKETVTDEVFSNFIFIFILHFLRDLPPFVESFLRNGAFPEDVFIAPIPYSTNLAQYSIIESLGVNVSGVAEYGIHFEQSISLLLSQAVKRSSITGKKIIVVEDGGYISGGLLDEHSDNIDKFVGVVEQTTNGIYPIRKFIDDGGTLEFPMINVAETELKQQREAPYIGRAVVDNLMGLLGGLKGSPIQELVGKQVTVVGCGTIGRETIKELVARQAAVCAVEIDLEKHTALTQEFSENDAVEILPIGKAMNGIDHLGSCDVLIGCSGIVHLDTKEKFLCLKDRVVLVNASSKRREFDWDVVVELYPHENAAVAFGMERWRLEDDGKKVQTIFFAANGFPINFFTGNSVPVEVIEPIMSMLFRGALGLATGDSRVKANGLYLLPKEWETEIRVFMDQRK